MIPSLPLDVQGGIKGGLDDVAVNPLRLAALAASPLRKRRGEGIPIHGGNARNGKAEAGIH